MSEKVAPATTSGSSTAPEATCRSEATSSTKPITSTAPMESETGLTINQQLANHLASHAVGVVIGGKPPPQKRKRSSIDQRSVLSVRVQQQPLEMKKIGFIGAGNMARAIAEGWISSGLEEVPWSGVARSV